MWKLQRDFDVLVLHDLQDLQALGSLTTIWVPLSDTWDTAFKMIIEKATQLISLLWKSDGKESFLNRWPIR